MRARTRHRIVFYGFIVLAFVAVLGSFGAIVYMAIEYADDMAETG